MSKQAARASVRAMAAEGRLEQAARLARDIGDSHEAAELFERACLFSDAAACALDAGDATRSLLLAVLAGESAVTARAIEALVMDPKSGRAAAHLLLGRGNELVAAQLLERLGDTMEAADAFAAAGRAVDASRLYLVVGEARRAARVLEAAHQRDPHDEHLVLALGELLTTHGKHEAAFRLLQRLGPDSALRASALPLLIQLTAALDLDEPHAALVQEAARHEIAPRSLQRASPRGTEQVIGGRYEIVRQAASTHAARVFEAIDRMTGERVAVKQLMSARIVGGGRDALHRLAREARILAQLRHPNVVPLVELTANPDAIVTQWMAGGSLHDLLEREPIVPARAIEIACALLGGLAEAHRLGIIHRDIKPSNILFDASGVPRLADFGAAHLADASVTATAGVIGTLAYMSPEQRSGRPATTASDIFSMGATLLEMLTGAAPEMSGATTAPSAVHGELSAEHDATVLSMIAAAPEVRPPSAMMARELLARLRWPASLPYRRVQAQPVEAEASRARLRCHPDGTFEDTWLGRRVLVVPASPSMQRVARGYVAASSSCLSTVLRFDLDANELWFEVPAAPTLAELGAGLSDAQMQMLRTALRALHAQGVAHGSLDAQHVRVCGELPIACFEPRTADTAEPQADMEALEALPRR